MKDDDNKNINETPLVDQAIESYQTKANMLVRYFDEIKVMSQELIQSHEIKIEHIENGVLGALQKIEETYQHDIIREDQMNLALKGEVANYESILLSQGQDLTAREELLKNLKDIIDFAHKTKKEEINQIFQENREQLDTLPKNTKENLINDFEQKKIELYEEFRKKTFDFDAVEIPIFNTFPETTTDISIFGESESIEKQANSYINIGKSDVSIDFFDYRDNFVFHHFVPFFNKKHIFLKNSLISSEKATEIINALIGRAIRSFTSGNLQLHLIDPVNRGRNFRKFAKLSSDIKTIYTEEKEIEKLFKQLDKTLTKNFQNYLSDDFENLKEYNLVSKDTQPFHLVVLMDFGDNKYSKKSIKRLRGVIENGPIAGINVIIVPQKTEAKTKGKNVVDKYLKDFISHFSLIDLQNATTQNGINISPIEFYTDIQVDINTIINHVNANIKS